MMSSPAQASLNLASCREPNSDLISEHRSSIVFANSRRLAERLTAHLNELHAERLGELLSRSRHQHK